MPTQYHPFVAHIGGQLEVSRLRPVPPHPGRCIAPMHAHGSSDGSGYLRGAAAYACGACGTRSEGTPRGHYGRELAGAQAGVKI